MVSKALSVTLLALCLSLLAAASAAQAERRYGTGYDRYTEESRYRTSGWRSPFFSGGTNSVFGLRRTQNGESRRLYGMQDRTMRNILDNSGPSRSESSFRLRSSTIKRSVLGSSRQMYGVRRVRR